MRPACVKVGAVPRHAWYLAILSKNGRVPLGNQHETHPNFPKKQAGIVFYLVQVLAGPIPEESP